MTRPWLDRPLLRGIPLPPSGETENTPNTDDVLMQLRSMMASEFGLSHDDIEPGAHLVDDLDLDSIDLVDLAVTLEDQSGIKLDEDEIKSVRTVGDAVTVIHAAFTRRSAGAA